MRFLPSKAAHASTDSAEEPSFGGEDSGWAIKSLEDRVIYYWGETKDILKRVYQLEVELEI
jgi:hypothetical protein